jgi:hypothetical protein
VVCPSLCGPRSRIRVKPDKSDPRPNPRTQIFIRFVTDPSGKGGDDQDATTGVAAEYRTLACKAAAVIAVVVRISLAVLAVYLVAKL